MLWNTWLRKFKRQSFNKISPKVKNRKRGQYGHVDIIDENGIAGWFVNLDNEEDKELSLYINDNFVGKVKPSYYRPDVNQIFQKTILSGFSIGWNELNIPEYLLEAPEWYVEIKYEGRPLAGKSGLKGESLQVVKSKLVISKKLTVDLKHIDSDELKFYIDRIEIQGNDLHIIGWCYSKENSDFTISIKNAFEEHVILLRKGIPREEVQQSLGIKQTLHSGFYGIWEGVKEGSFKLLLEVNSKQFVLGNFEIKQASKSKWLKGYISHFLDGLIENHLKREERFENERLPELVDIIIPVFNGYIYLKPLFENLLKNTNEPYRVIVIDDGSNDYRVVEFLEKLKHDYPEKILLIRNEMNKGFTASVNRGLLEVNNRHVVILNTDVEVPPGWLYRLMKPIFENEDIASTTPFTNAGTICSFPEFLKDNKIHDISLEDIDRVFSKVDGEKFLVEMPTAIGFCMGINKKALKEVGLFDDQAFPIGYGEENDWCMRARKRGHLNVMVPNLFIYHKHGGSFSEEKRKALIEKHLNKLKELHPEYLTLVEDYIKIDPVKPIRNLLGILLFSKNKNTTLIVDHSIGGGANIYREALVKERLKEGACVLLYTATYYSPYKKLTCIYDKYSFEIDVKDFTNALKLFRELNIKEIVLNNLVSYSEPLKVLEGLIQLKEETGANLIMPVHDYYLICPSYNLLNKEGLYCGVPEDLKKCQECIRENFYSDFPHVKYIDLWRKAWGKVLDIADRVICFSKSSVDIIKRAYPQLYEGKVRILPHNLNVVPRKPQINFKGGPVKVGIIGAINYQKGSQVIFELARRVKEKRLPMELHVIGWVHRGIPDELKSIITVHGKYEREKLPDITESIGIHVVLFPSIWPETFSYVVEEVIHMDLPLVCFDIGAPAERVKLYQKVKVIQYMIIDAVIEGLIELGRKEWS